MTKAWCIVGMPGSGKTMLADRLAYVLSQPLIIDDIRAMSQLPPNGVFSDVIVIDPYFCITSVRHRAHAILTARYDETVWIYFENAPEKCLINTRFRNDDRKVDHFIRFLTRDYHVPPFSDVRPIWQPEDEWR